MVCDEGREADEPEEVEQAMKAWLVGSRYIDWKDHYAILIHAETREKARKIFIDACPDWIDYEYTDIKAIRAPTLDGVPFTGENVIKARIFIDDEDYPLSEYWLNFCPCEMWG